MMLRLSPVQRVRFLKLSLAIALPVLPLRAFIRVNRHGL